MKNNILAILLFYTSVCFAQTRSELFFDKGSRVCFVGNSITHSGEFHHNILMYHITRFPEQPLSFYNCGIVGDFTDGVLNRIEDDILVHQPSHAVVMLGMNDVNRSLYGSEETTNADTLRRREETINAYKANIEKIVNVFLSKNIKVILQKPSIYDQTAVLQTPNNFGVNDALKTCADYIGELAEKYKLPTVDYWTIMSKINQKMQEKDPSATITSPDRVHPASTGNLVMAYQFLKSEGAPQYVSKVIIDKNIDKSSKKSLDCEIRSVSKCKDGMTFTVKENALPFPVIEDQRKGIELVPFMNELNVELLQVNNLKQGQYQLSIDGNIIGVFSDVQFKDGINLAEYKNTPQYYQAMKVRNMLGELWQMDLALRDIKFIEYDQYFKSCPDIKNLVVVKTYLDSLFTLKYNSPYFDTLLVKYIENKPKQKEFEEASDTLRREVYRMALPLDHIFILTNVQSIIH